MAQSQQPRRQDPNEAELDIQPLDLQPAEESGGITDYIPESVKSIWKSANEPLMTAPSRFARDVSSYLDLDQGGWSKAILEGAGDIVSGATSPLNLATMASFGGAGALAKGLPMAARGLTMLGGALSAPVAAEGAYDVYNEPTIAGKGLGALEAAGGLLGMRQAATGLRGLRGLKPGLAAEVPQTSYPKGWAPKDLKSKASMAGEPVKPVLPAEFTAVDEVLPNAPIEQRPVKSIEDATLDRMTEKRVQQAEFEKMMTEKGATTKKVIKVGGKDVELDIPKASDEMTNFATNMDLTELMKTLTPDEIKLLNSVDDFGKLPKDLQRKLGPALSPAEDDIVLQQMGAKEKPYKAPEGTPNLRMQQDGSWLDIDNGSKYSSQGELIDEAGKKAPQVETNEAAVKTLRSLASKPPSMLQEIASFPRALLSSMDFSAPGRQAFPLIYRKEYWQSFDDMFKSWGSQKAYDEVVNSIKSKPMFQPTVTEAGKVVPSFAERAGLDLTDSFGRREEAFRSRLAEKIPGVLRSERAYNAFLNKLRADTFRNLVNKSKALGRNPETDEVLAKQIASFVNKSTGRGSLGRLEPVADDLANAFFSPKLMASRVQIMGQIFNPKFYTQLDPMVRKESLKSLLAIAGASQAINVAANVAGGTTGFDPISTDFLKTRFGNSRLDPNAGFQQYIVAANRIVSGKATSARGKNQDLTSSRFGARTRGDVATDFVTSKLAPVPSLVWAWMNNREFDGTPFEIKNALAQRTIPIVAQDIVDLYNEDPSLLPLGVPAALGLGLQTYGR